jgi:murein DD-endopeptidase MepM/ murein hydrolase activator NlpD
MHRRRALVAVLTLSLTAVLLTPPLASFGLSRSDADAARKRADAARSKQASAQKQAERLLADTHKLETTISRTRSELAGIDAKVSAVDARRAKLESEMAALRKQIAGKQSQIASATVAFRQRRLTLGRRADVVYREGDLFYLQILIESRSLSDLLARTTFVQQVMVHDTTIMTELTETQQALEKAKTSLGRSVQELTAKAAELAAEENTLRGLQSDRASRLAEQRGAQSEKQSLLVETKQNIAHLKAQVAAEEAEAARIDRMLRDKASHGHGQVEGTLAWPVPGHTTITSPFGWRIHPILKTRKFHSGIDIRAPEGARIVAAGAGTVIYAGDRGGYGNCTMIDHGDGVVTVYAHQSAIAVSVGEHVRRGQRIGAVGSTGLSTGPHLHFEVHVNGDPRDPEDYL